MTDFPMPPQDILQYLLETCKTSGASDADARLNSSQGMSVSVREGKLETIERDEGAGVSLRCFFGKQQASVSGTDLSQEGLKTLAERCSKMAEAAPEDPYCGLVSSDMLARDIPEFDLSGDGDETPEMLETDALAAESAAMAVQGIVQVPSCSAGCSRSERWLAASNGFSAYKAGGSSSVGLSALAEKDGAMETDYAARHTRRREDRLKPAQIGALAAERTLAKARQRR